MQPLKTRMNLMINQQINLYRFFIKPKEEKNYLSWHYSLLYTAAFILLVFLWGGYLGLSNHHLKNEDKLYDKKIASLNKIIAGFKKKYPDFLLTPDAKNILEAGQKDINAQYKVLNQIKRGIPFSSILLGLSKSIVENVWLNTIYIKQHSNFIILNGNTTDITAGRTFLSNLSDVPIFSGYNFNVTNKTVNQKKISNHLIYSFQLNISKGK